MPQSLEVIALHGIPEVGRGAVVGRMIVDAAAAGGPALRPGDIVVVAQKVVSKAEGALVALTEVTPSPAAVEWATAWRKDAATVEVVLREARRIVRMERGIIIAETRHGFVCANAGVDASNVPPGFVSLLPRDPDASAAGIRDVLTAPAGGPIGVIVSDTFGRPWREGAVNVAIGIAGLRPLADYRGTSDQFGRRLQTSVIAVADEIAAAAELVMGKAAGTPVAIVRGAGEWIGDGGGDLLLRPASMDLFR